MSKFESIEFKDEDVWGLIMRKDSPLAKKTYVTKEDILNIPLMLPIHVTNSLFSNQESIYEKWIGKKNLKDLNIIVTYNLLYNASVMVKAGLGYALALKGIINTEKDNSLCFRPLEPILTSKCKIAWKQNKNFSPAASVFLQKLKELFLTKNT